LVNVFFLKGKKEEQVRVKFELVILDTDVSGCHHNDVIVSSFPTIKTFSLCGVIRL